MDFAQIGAPKTTSFDGFVHPKDGPVDIVVTGITAAHEDYEPLKAKYNPPSETHTFYFTDDGERRMEIPHDAEGDVRMRKMLAAMVTNIDNITGWQFSPKATEELFLRSDCTWMVKQWKEHLDDEGKHSPRPSRKPARTAKS